MKPFLSIALFFIFAGLVLASPSSKSEDANSSPAAPPMESASMQASSPAAEAPMEEYQFPVFQTIGGLGLVLSLIAGGFFGLKKIAPQYFAKCTAGKTLKVVETLPMGDRRSISLIQVANSRYLIGNTAQQISFLTALPDAVSLVSEPEIPPVEPGKESKKGSKRPFRNIFESEKNRSTLQTGHPLPEDLRTKMRQLREALERG